MIGWIGFLWGCADEDVVGKEGMNKIVMSPPATRFFPLGKNPPPPVGKPRKAGYLILDTVHRLPMSTQRMPGYRYLPFHAVGG